MTNLKHAFAYIMDQCSMSWYWTLYQYVINAGQITMICPHTGTWYTVGVGSIAVPCADYGMYWAPVVYWYCSKLMQCALYQPEDGTWNLTMDFHLCLLLLVVSFYTIFYNLFATLSSVSLFLCAGSCLIEHFYFLIFLNDFNFSFIFCFT